MTKEPYDDLYRAIGRVVFEWAYLESAVSALVFDLSAIHAPQLYEDTGTDVIVNALSANLDLRANIAIIKSLAFYIPDEPDFFGRSETIINPISNELRNTRNRYVHDLWSVRFGQAFCYKSGTVIRKEPGTGTPQLEFGDVQHYETISSVEEFADRIHLKRREVRGLGKDAQAIYRRLYPPTKPQ